MIRAESGDREVRRPVRVGGCPPGRRRQPRRRPSGSERSTRPREAIIRATAAANSGVMWSIRPERRDRLALAVVSGRTGIRHHLGVGGQRHRLVQQRTERLPAAAAGRRSSPDRPSRPLPSPWPPCGCRGRGRPMIRKLVRSRGAASWAAPHRCRNPAVSPASRTSWAKPTSPTSSTSNSNEVTMPKFAPAPRTAQNRSGFSCASARRPCRRPARSRPLAGGRWSARARGPASQCRRRWPARRRRPRRSRRSSAPSRAVRVRQRRPSTGRPARSGLGGSARRGSRSSSSWRGR